MFNTWAWILLGAIILLLLLRRVIYRRRDDPSEQVRYMIRSSEAPSTAQQLGAKSGLQIVRYYFRNTEAEHGPPDHDVFYDELFIDLKDPESGQTWQNSIHVATPRGLDRAMVEEHWDSVIGTELLIVRRYDLQTILNGAIDHLQEIYEVQLQFLNRPPQEKPDLIG
ncbi:MAG: hypothetical protein ACE14M_11465 [Terriglobales bacterium]